MEITDEFERSIKRQIEYHQKAYKALKEVLKMYEDQGKIEKEVKVINPEEINLFLKTNDFENGFEFGIKYDVENTDKSLRKIRGRLFMNTLRMFPDLKFSTKKGSEGVMDVKVYSR